MTELKHRTHLPFDIHKTNFLVSKNTKNKMKIFTILMLVCVGVNVAYVLKSDENMMKAAGRAVEEMYEKHPNELKNFGPFLEEYYKSISKPEAEVVKVADNFEYEDFKVPLEIETVFADVNQDDFQL